MITDQLTALISEKVLLRLIEPHTYSVFQDDHGANDYDTGFGNIYDKVACNPLYNRLIWGYSIGHFTSLTEEALASSPNGYVLDLGCGSLAFTVRTYIKNTDRPVVFLDQSLKMLRLARSRMTALNGMIPESMVFLHADALKLPFKPHVFNTIISLNLLHCVADIAGLVTGARNALSDDGKMYFTTLIKADRVADRYFDALARSDKLVSRGVHDLRIAFQNMKIPLQLELMGNLASLYC
ncbi:MAG: class I SAM-dependent methyltransferase [Pseudomonadota bacterium]